VALLLLEAGGLLFALALAVNLAALVGLAAMIATYRRAARAVIGRGGKDGS